MLLHKVVIMTYNEVRISYPKFEKPDDMTPEEIQRLAEKEFKEKAGPLHQIRFRRIILNEGHQIRNPESQTSITVRALHAHYKWILSGTPLVNYSAEFWAYFNFLGVPNVGPIDKFFRSFCCGSEPANNRLLNAIKSISLRRTHKSKLLACPIIKLPAIEEHRVAVMPFAIERALYRMVSEFFIDGINCMANNDDQEAQNRCFLTMLLKLRMLNSHLLCAQDILKKMLAVNGNLAKLRSFLDDQADNATACDRDILSIIQSLVKAGKQTKGRYVEPAERPLESKFLDLIRNLTNNNNLEECQERMKCVRCDNLEAKAHITAFMHLICEDCLQVLKESDVSEDSKVVCPVCTEKKKVGTEIFSKNPSFLTIQLGVKEELIRVKGPKRKYKRISNWKRNNFFMKIVEDNDDSNDALIDWVEFAGEKIPSSKVIRTRELIRAWMAADSQNKIVIFTQFRAMAAIFSGMCKQEKWAHAMLTGEMGFASRKQSIEDFQENPEISVMIASLKAGGIGLDLTAGNKCIFVEPWWNDAIQQQAFCRIFRIGQQRNVQIVKLVTTDTIDDYMTELQKLKLQEIEVAIGDATLPLSGAYALLMQKFGNVSMSSNGA